MRFVIVVILFAAVLGHGLDAAAQQAGYNVDYDREATVIGIAGAGILVAAQVSVDTTTRWDSEIFGALDLRVRDNFSTTAATASDVLIAATVATPLVLTLDRGLDEDAGRRALLYGESLAVSLFANAATKYLVKRPRPYNYNPDPRVQEYARKAGKDSHLSFYSGHSSTAFTAAMTGSYLFSLGTDSDRVKAAAWFLQFALAGTTATLRVRAGKHYYSDIAVGALAGGAIGFLVPALHADDRGVYSPSVAEWGALAGGVALGVLAGHLWPLKNDIAVPMEKPTNISLVPFAHESGGGIAVLGQL